MQAKIYFEFKSGVVEKKWNQGEQISGTIVWSIVQDAIHIVVSGAPLSRTTQSIINWVISGQKSRQTKNKALAKGL